MIFHDLTLLDRHMYEKALAESSLFHDYLGSELNFQNLFVWKRYDAIVCGTLGNGTVVSRGVRTGIPFYLPPIAASEKEFIAAISLLEADAADRNVPFLVRGLSGKLADILRKSGRKYRIDEERNLFEYLYDAAALRSLSGNKYHNKRNFVNRFLKNGDHVFRAYEPKDKPAVETMLWHWEQRKMQAFEHDAILEVLDHLADLACFADLLFVGDRLAAFAIGTIAGKTGLVLFEKADTRFPGVYAAINYLFANKRFADVSVINRQEDIGIPDLRKAKMSYNPIGFVEKFSLTRDHLSRVEVDELKSLYAEAFAEDSPVYREYFFAQKYRADNVVFHKENGIIVSALHLVRKTLSLLGMEMPVPFIVAAATRRDRRSQGLMRSVILQTFAELYNRKMALCALTPFRESFYQSFGFVTIARTKTVKLTVSTDDGRSYRRATKDDLAILDSLYRRKIAGYDLFIERKLDAWLMLVEETAAGDGEILIVSENDEPIGYFIRIDHAVTEICMTDDAVISTLSRLNGCDVDLEGGSLDASRSMIRIIDVIRFLKSYPYCTNESFIRRIKIVDPFFEQNNVTVEWRVSLGTVSLREIEAADETVTIEELTRMAFCEAVLPFCPVKTLIFDQY